jgi:hypothetical protein
MLSTTTTRSYQFEGNLFVADIAQDLVSDSYKGQLPKDFDLGDKDNNWLRVFSAG